MMADAPSARYFCGVVPPLVLHKLWRGEMPSSAATMAPGSGTCHWKLRTTRMLSTADRSRGVDPPASARAPRTARTISPRGS